MLALGKQIVLILGILFGVHGRFLVLVQFLTGLVLVQFCTVKAGLLKIKTDIPV